MTRPSPDTAEFAVLADAGPKRPWLVGLLAALGLSGLLAARPIAGRDLWWHLALGREAVASRDLPNIDAFSYTLAGAAPHRTDVGGNVALYWMFDRFEFVGLTFLSVLMVRSPASLWPSACSTRPVCPSTARRSTWRETTLRR